MKRGILYSTCKREGYGVLALGQHLDDQALLHALALLHTCTRAHMHSGAHATRARALACKQSHAWRVALLLET